MATQEYDLGYMEGGKLGNGRTGAGEREWMNESGDETPYRLYAQRTMCDTYPTLLRRFGTIRAQGRQRTTRDDTLCDHLRCLILFYNTLQCSLSLLRPFLTFSDAFRPFATFLDFALFNTPPFCVAFSETFHQTLFT